MRTTTYEDDLERLARRRRRQLAEAYQDAIRNKDWDACRAIVAQQQAETVAAEGPSVSEVRPAQPIASDAGRAAP